MARRRARNGTGWESAAGEVDHQLTTHITQAGHVQFLTLECQFTLARDIERGRRRYHTLLLGNPLGLRSALEILRQAAAGTLKARRVLRVAGNRNEAVLARRPGHIRALEDVLAS